MAKRSPKAAHPGPNPDCRLAVFHGKEAHLRRAHTAGLRDALAAHHGQLEEFLFDGASCDAADVLDECRSFGLMAGFKLVLVDNADRLLSESTRPLFERYAGAPSDQACLVLRSDNWRPGRLDKSIAALGDRGLIIKCEPPGDAEAAQACVAFARRAGVPIDAHAAALLVERIGPDLGRLETEVDKLAVVAIAHEPSEPRITEAIVHEQTGELREEQFWSVQNALATGDPRAAVTHLRHLLETAPREAHIPITSAVVDLVRKTHAAAAMTPANRTINPSLVKSLRLWGPSADAVRAIAGRVPPAWTAALLDRAVATDAAQKTGLGRPDRQLEVLAVAFCRLMQRASSGRQ